MARRPHPQRTATTECEHGAMCIDDRDGHAITLMRLRLAHVAADGWVDAVVVGRHIDGTVELARWADGTRFGVWHHVDRRDLLGDGTIVAVHPRYGVLAAGAPRLNLALR